MILRSSLPNATKTHANSSKSTWLIYPGHHSWSCRELCCSNKAILVEHNANYILVDDESSSGSDSGSDDDNDGNDGNDEGLVLY